jgi:hypothetical protein
VENTLATELVHRVVRDPQRHDTCDIHLRGGAYVIRTQIARTVLRNSVTGTLDGFAAEGYASATYDIPTDIDDLYIDPHGENLGEPGEEPSRGITTVYLVADSRMPTAGARSTTSRATLPGGGRACRRSDFLRNPINSDPVNPSTGRDGFPATGNERAPGYSGALPVDDLRPGGLFGGALADRHPDRRLP